MVFVNVSYFIVGAILQRRCCLEQGFRGTAALRETVSRLRVSMHNSCGRGQGNESAPTVFFDRSVGEWGRDLRLCTG